MRHVDAAHAGVRWEGSFTVDEPGRWTFTIEAWTDAFASWREELDRKVAAGVEDLSGELSEGVLLLERVCGLAEGDDRVTLERALSVVRDTTAPTRTRAEAALALDLLRRRPALARPAGVDDPAAARRARRRSRACPVRLLVRAVPALVGRVRGRPRGSSPRLAELGFDVLYLPPIHPIGVTNRKGANNALVAGPGDPGSPWAIGDATGGHDAIHPDLGTLDDVRRARRRGPPRRRRDLPRLRDPVLGRPPVAHRPPRVVQPPPGRDAEVRREPAQEVPGHLQRQLAVRGLAPPLAGAAGRGPASGSRTACASSASTTRTRSRSRSGSG